MAMALAGKKKGVQCSINITPYIDILLVLLIIFMVAAPLKKHEEPVRVPQTAVSEQQKKVVQDTLVIDVDINKGIRLNQQPIGLEALGSALTQLFSHRVNRNLLIRGDGKLPYGDVFKILDLAKQSGAGDIALLESSSGEPGRPDGNTTALLQKPKR
jgi:biopolymer transport protein ExbD